MSWQTSPDGVDTTAVSTFTDFDVGTVYSFTSDSMKVVDVDANDNNNSTDGEVIIIDGVATADIVGSNVAWMDGIVTYTDGTTDNVQNLWGIPTADGQVIWAVNTVSTYSGFTSGLDPAKTVESFEITGGLV